MANDGKDVFNKIASIGIKDSNKDVADMKRRATISGAAVGAVAGMYYGYSKKKNILIMGTVGAVAGAIISRLLMPK